MVLVLEGWDVAPEQDGQVMQGRITSSDASEIRTER